MNTWAGRLTTAVLAVSLSSVLSSSPAPASPLPLPVPSGSTSAMSTVSLVLSSASSVTSARSFARANGLSILHAGPGVVELQGPADTLASLFGTSMSTRSVQGRNVNSHAGPLSVPGALQGQVQAAVGLSDEPLMNPRTIPGGYTPMDFAHAYHLGGAVTAGTGLTIGTVQFSDWYPNDANVYAQAAGIGLRSGQITRVSVGDPGPISNNPDGALEVALDVETLMATAPGANQRVFIAHNDGAGILANYDAVLNDAQQGLIQVASVSWGTCEAQASGLIPYLSPIIAGIVKAGVTVFAASGDSGSAACQGSTAAAVDYPASDPSVVGVGGTKLVPAWTETAWPGSGGGVSQVFNRPSYQSTLTALGTGRMVPDVASDADMYTGLGLYLGGRWVKGGGTSMSAPTWAGGLASTLAEVSCTQGVGDIHNALYSHPAALRDITSVVSNGAYSSTTGYDAVTGLGSPLWDVLGPFVSAPCRPPPPTPALPGGFTGMTPTRVLDTRDGTGAPQAKLGAGATLTLTVPGLPAGVTAVALNVTATDPTTVSFLTVYPGGGSQPKASNLNFVARQTIPNLVLVPLGLDNTVTFYNNAGTVNVVADLMGSFAPATGAGFTGIAPTRVLDTRYGVGAQRAKVGAGATLTLTVPGLAAGTTAVAMNVTVTDPSAVSFLTVYPDGGSRPTASNLNFGAGQTIPNLVLVPVGPGNAVTFYNNAGTVNVIADLVGSFVPGTGGGFTGMRPTRVMDTRHGTGAQTAKLGAGATLRLTIPGLPAGTTAVALNVTATDASAVSFLTVFADGGSRPTASNLNFGAGQTIPNLVLVPVVAGNTVTFYNDAGSVNVIADLIGYFS